VYRDGVEGLQPACVSHEGNYFEWLFITYLTGNKYQIFVVLQNTVEGTEALFINFLWSLKI
jgi:hypothetical protein